jgi:hypothetical protein
MAAERKMYIKFTIFLNVIFALTLAACAGQLGGSIVDRSKNDRPSLRDGTRSPLDPIPGEENMTRGAVTINESELLILESYPLQIVLELEGELPTPCHNLRAKASEPDAQNRIQVELYSLSEPDVVCIQVLQPFKTSINLGSFPDGTYTVWVNGEQVGEFTQ